MFGQNTQSQTRKSKNSGKARDMNDSNLSCLSDLKDDSRFSLQVSVVCKIIWMHKTRLLPDLLSNRKMMLFEDDYSMLSETLDWLLNMIGKKVLLRPMVL